MEHAYETVESVCPADFGSIFIPVSSADVASVISWNATAVNNDSQDHESHAGGDFHYTENKFDLTRLAGNTSRA
jgi:hypothetical protein